MDPLHDAITTAIEAGRHAAAKEPRAVAVRFDAVQRRLVIELASGAELSIMPALLGLSPEADLSGARVEGGGFDLYFPIIDEGALVADVCAAALDSRLAA